MGSAMLVRVQSSGFFLIVVLFAAAAGYQWWRNSQLRDGLANLAKSNGWQFTPRADDLAGTWRVDPFGKGSSRQVRNAVQGKKGGWPFASFDYQYTTRSGDDTQTHEYAVTAVALAVPLPELSVVPDNVVSRLFGGSDIDFESEDFNRRFRVTAASPKFAYDVLTPRTMQMLLQQPLVSWHFEGQWMVLSTRGDLTPTVLLSQLDTASKLLAGIPAFVWRDAGAPEATA